MNIVLLTSDYHISANIAIKTFLQNPRLKKHNINVKGIIVTCPYSIGGSSWGKMQDFIKRAGWSFSIKSIITTIWQKFIIKFAKWFIPDSAREHFEFRELAAQQNIPFLKVSNINSKQSKNFIRKTKPEYLVSCFLLQIIDKEILNIPEKGSINVHPALIQKHRGTFTSLWAILKNWKTSGATVHFMTEKPDDGKIILQKHFFVYPSDTINCINRKSAKLGANLLVKALIKLKKQQIIGFFLKKIGKMFKMPTIKEIGQFYNKGKSLIKTKDFFEI